MAKERKSEEWLDALGEIYAEAAANRVVRKIRERRQAQEQAEPEHQAPHARDETRKK